MMTVLRRFVTFISSLLLSLIVLVIDICGLLDWKESNVVHIQTLSKQSTPKRWTLLVLLVYSVLTGLAELDLKSPGFVF